MRGVHLPGRAPRRVIAAYITFGTVDRPIIPGALQRVDRPLSAVTPTRDELAALTGLPTRTDRQVRLAAEQLHRRGVEHVWVRLGAQGSLLSTPAAGVTAIPAIAATVQDVTGAGDSGLAAFCHALLEGLDPVEAARFGHAAASLTIASPHTVRPDLTPRLVRAALTPNS